MLRPGGRHAELHVARGAPDVPAARQAQLRAALLAERQVRRRRRGDAPALLGLRGPRDLLEVLQGQRPEGPTAEGHLAQVVDGLRRRGLADADPGVVLLHVRGGGKAGWRHHAGAVVDHLVSRLPRTGAQAKSRGRGSIGRAAAYGSRRKGPARRPQPAPRRRPGQRQAPPARPRVGGALALLLPRRAAAAGRRPHEHRVDARQRRRPGPAAPRPRPRPLLVGDVALEAPEPRGGGGFARGGLAVRRLEAPLQAARRHRDGELPRFRLGTTLPRGGTGPAASARR